MKYLGVDYGAKRVGLAVSDDSNSYAFPLSVIENSGPEDLTAKIVSVCKEKKIDCVVVGESKDFNMNENEIMIQVKKFVSDLRKAGLAVVLHPEFLSSLEAERLQGSNAMNDASAAAIILKSYLDTHNGK
ncbi:MAG: Holliday junction resolvase RuvX [bacterium]